MPWCAGGNDSLKIKLNADEAALLRQVVDEITDVIAGEEATPVHDRVPGPFEDPEESKYNTLVRDELKSNKLRALTAMRETLGDSGRVSATLPTSEATSGLPPSRTSDGDRSSFGRLRGGHGPRTGSRRPGRTGVSGSPLAGLTSGNDGGES